MLIPESLKRENRWVVAWYPEGRSGHPPKTPFRGDIPTETASSTDPATWTTYEIASDTVARHPGQLVLGFVLGGGFVGVDLDKCRDPETGLVDSEARAVIERLDSYTEVSPSGSGVHILVKGALPPGRRRKGKIEMYDGARYFTVTGDALSARDVEDRLLTLAELHKDIFGDELPPVLATELPGADEDLPDELDDLALVEKARTEFKNAERFGKLWEGDVSSYNDDFSAAIYAHLHQLAWLLGRNPERIDRMFRQSGLYEESEAARPKWDKSRGNSTWGRQQIEKAIRQTKDVYHAGGPTTIPNGPRKATLTFAKPAVPGQLGDYVLMPLREKFDGWWPRGRVHLVGGSSGTGKSTVTIPALVDQRARKTVLGHAGAGLPFIIITVDRQRLSNLETLERLGYTEAEVPLRPIADAVLDDEAAQAIVDLIEAEPVMPKVIFIEGMDFLVEEVNKIRCVGRFMHQLQLIAEHYHVAIIGSTGSPKSKTDSHYQQTRDMLLGTGGWGRKAEDVAVLTFEDPKEGNGRRKLTFEHRNAGTERFTLEFQGGRLVEAAPEDVEEDESLMAALAIVKERGTCRQVDVKNGLGVSGNTAKELLDTLLQAGRITRKTVNKVILYSYVQP